MESSCIGDVRRWARNLTEGAAQWRLAKATSSGAGNAYVYICDSLCHVCANMSVEENVRGGRRAQTLSRWVGLQKFRLETSQKYDGLEYVLSQIRYSGESDSSWGELHIAGYRVKLHRRRPTYDKRTTTKTKPATRARHDRLLFRASCWFRMGLRCRNRRSRLSVEGGERALPHRQCVDRRQRAA
jgi:hypothetical protein